MPTRVLHETHPDDFPSLTTEQLRARFLVEDLFDGAPGEPRFALIGYDRMLVGALVTTAAPVVLPAPPELDATSLCERREFAVLCLEGTAAVTVDGVRFELDAFDTLYVGMGAHEVAVSGESARTFLVATLAHVTHPTVLARAGDGELVVAGTADAGNRRTIRKVVHEGGIASAQLTLGITTLEEGSVWNTMPPHVHERRTELYLYTGLGAGDRVVHLAGPPGSTAPIIVADGQLVVAPPWSVHTGAGTAAYSFVWMMAGEHRDFSDMQLVGLDRLR